MKFTFSHRIIGGFLIMGILSIFMGYFAFITTNNLQRVSNAIMKENVSSLKAAEELEIALLSQKGLVSSYFLDGNASWLKTLDEKKKDFGIWFKKAEEVALTDNEKKILQEILVLYSNYDKQRNKAVRLYQSGSIEAAKRILLNDMKNSIDYLYQKCEDLILANEVLILKAERSSQRHVTTMTSLMWITIVLTLSLGTFSGFFIARKINIQLVRSAKLASLGQLSANIAHEIRNPLTSVKMRLYSLEKELKDNPSTHEDIRVISEEINRMEKTVKDFLDFSKPPALNLQKCDINEILETTVSLLAPKMNVHNILMQKKFYTGPLELEVDKEQMRQVFLNVILNAIEAMPNGGLLEIATNIDEDSDLKKVFEIKIKDTGSGITPEAQSRLFEPFFTTKSDGTGLGLFIVSRIIHMHKGRIDLESQLEKETTVTIKLPVS